MKNSEEPNRVTKMTAAIDALAAHVRRLPDLPLTIAHRDRLRVIADWLRRRAEED